MLTRRHLLAASAAWGLAGCAGGRGGGLSAPEEISARPQPHARGPGERALSHLFTALARLDDHTAAGPVSIVQVGDSHSAGDFFSARMRELFQARFGAAGRGLLPPGRADRYYDPKLVSVSETGWQRESARGGAGVVPFGIAGVTQSANGPARMTLTAEEPAGFDRVMVVFRRRPDGGSFAVSVDGSAARSVATAGAGQAVRADFRCAPGSRTLTVETAGDGPVDLLGWGSYRHAQGVLYQNFGIIGAQVDVLGLYDPQSVSTELHDAALLVIEFGTNEAFGRADDLADYSARFSRCVGMLADAAPGASILVVGPPDVNRRAGAAGADAQVCDPLDQPQATPLPTTWLLPPAPTLAGLHAHHAGGGGRAGGGHAGGGHAGGGHGHGAYAGWGRGGSRLHAGGRSRGGRYAHHHHGGDSGGGGVYAGGGLWARPAQVDMVAAAQRETARAEGWAFWDWSAAMGGPCSMVGWVSQRLGRADHVHMSTDGYGQSAELLFHDIMSQYDAWRAGPPPGATARSGPG